jgi:hypothetical protein
LHHDVELDEAHLLVPSVRRGAVGGDDTFNVSVRCGHGVFLLVPCRGEGERRKEQVEAGCVVWLWRASKKNIKRSQCGHGAHAGDVSQRAHALIVRRRTGKRDSASVVSRNRELTS